MEIRPITNSVVPEKQTQTNESASTQNSTEEILLQAGPSYSSHRILSKEESVEQQHLDLEMLDRIMAESKQDSSTQTFYRAMDQALDEIDKADPLINQTDWDFSVDQDNQIILKESQALSDEQRSIIVDALNKYGLSDKVAAYADDMISIIELERGVDGLSDNIGRYDLNRENFADIVNMRQLNTDVSSSEYNSKNGTKMASLGELANQLAEKAEAKYQLVIYSAKGR